MARSDADGIRHDGESLAVSASLSEADVEAIRHTMETEWYEDMPITATEHVGKLLAEVSRQRAEIARLESILSKLAEKD